MPAILWQKPLLRRDEEEARERKVTFVEPPARFALWGLGLLCDALAPVASLGPQRRLPQLTTSRLPERFGLFTLIVLGESVVGAVSGAAEAGEIGPETAVTAVLGLALAFTVWWIYFDHVFSRRPRPGIGWTLAWMYSHILLLASLTALGPGVLRVISGDGASAPLLLGGLAAVFFALSTIEGTLPHPETGGGARSVRALAAPLLLFSAALGSSWSGLALVGTGLAVALAALVAGLVSGPRSPSVASHSRGAVTGKAPNPR